MFKAQRKPYNMFKRRKVIDEVVSDLTQRSEIGNKKYGTYLYPFNGRSAQIDDYQELLDSIMYKKQYLIEQEIKANVSKALTISICIVASIVIAYKIKR